MGHRPSPYLYEVGELPHLYEIGELTRSGAKYITRTALQKSSLPIIGVIMTARLAFKADR